MKIQFWIEQVIEADESLDRRERIVGYPIFETRVNSTQDNSVAEAGLVPTQVTLEDAYKVLPDVATHPRLKIAYEETLGLLHKGSVSQHSTFALYYLPLTPEQSWHHWYLERGAELGTLNLELQTKPEEVPNTLEQVLSFEEAIRTKLTTFLPH